MKRARVAAACLSCALLIPAAVEAGPLVFVDDFNRPDGVLGPPWVALEAPLHIRSQVAVADSNEYGLMMYTDAAGCHCDDASLEVALNFQFDFGGRFQIFLAGASGPAYSGFIGKLALDHFSLYGLPEVHLATRPLALSPVASYRLRLAYDRATTTASLVLTGADGTPVDTISVTAAAGPLTACAIGIENLNQPYHAKWLDDVRFDYCCEATSAPRDIPFDSWGRVKSRHRR